MWAQSKTGFYSDIATQNKEIATVIAFCSWKPENRKVIAISFQENSGLFAGQSKKKAIIVPR